MLSYQHIYHAGNAADIHKHLWLITVLEYLLKKGTKLFWADTHAGRGLYNLQSAEAQKTAEYKTGFIPVHTALGSKPDLPGCLRSYFENYNDPNYFAGSALIAARMLGGSDRLHAYELHKGEYAYLEEALLPFAHAKTFKAEGAAGLLASIPPQERRGGALIDPSYEVKTEYAQTAELLKAALRKWPKGVFLIWYPILPAGHHVAFVKALTDLSANVCIDEWHWAKPAPERRGLLGSGMAVFNSPYTTAETMSCVRSLVLPVLKSL